MALVVGLGNPGLRYADTRHNAGWRVIDALVARWVAGAGESDATYRSWRAIVKGRDVALMTPLTFMNLSGDAIAAWRERHALDPVAMLVVMDDVYLPIGTLRLRAGGSSGGHRGLESIVGALAKEDERVDLARLRVGVGAASAEDLREHVLAPPPADEAERFEESIVRAADAVECWIENGIVAAMNRFNRHIGEEDLAT